MMSWHGNPLDPYGNHSLYKGPVMQKFDVLLLAWRNCWTNSGLATTRKLVFLPHDTGAHHQKPGSPPTWHWFPPPETWHSSHMTLVPTTRNLAVLPRETLVPTTRNLAVLPHTLVPTTRNLAFLPHDTGSHHQKPGSPPTWDTGAHHQKPGSPPT